MKATLGTTFFLLSLLVEGEMRFTLNGVGREGRVPYFQHGHGQRVMQLQQNKVDFTAVSDSCRYDDEGFSDPKLYCNVTTRFSGANGTYVDVDVALECDSSQSTVSFRQAENCLCSAVMTDQVGQVKNCTCSVCSVGFGDNPIYFECEEDALVDECSVLDCDYRCNGPCKDSCETSGDSCLLCVNTTEEIPPSGTPNTNENVLEEVVFYENNSGCSKNLDRMTCTNTTTVTAKDGSRSNIEVSVECDALPLGMWDYRESTNCICSVNVTDQLGQSGQNCECAVCPTGFGATPISLICHGSSVVGGCSRVDCNAKCEGTCDHECESAGEDCPMCIPPVVLDRNTTVDECRTTSTQLICNRETRVTSPDNTTFSDMDIEVQCALTAPGDYNFQNSTNCTCSVNVTDHTGNPRNCECSICPDNFGSNPISIQCQNDHVVGECSSLDCNSECNGSCNNGCEDAGPECRLCTVQNPNAQNPNVTIPVKPGTDFLVTPTPSVQPVATTAPLSTQEEQTYSYTGFTVRLEGGKQINSVTKVTFARTTEAFYRSVFQTQSAPQRRQLQDLSFSSFDTTVRATEENLDAMGNTITYDQSITFHTEAGFLAEDQARDLLLKQLTDGVTKQQYMDMLHEAHPDFLSIIEVNPKNPRSGGDDSGGLDLLIIILLAVGVLVCCCCCVASLILRKRRNNVEEESDADKEKPGTDYPEAPLGEEQERHDPSDHTDFSNENERKTEDRIVPFGAGDGNGSKESYDNNSWNVRDESENSYGFD